MKRLFFILLFLIYGYCIVYSINAPILTYPENMGYNFDYILIWEPVENAVSYHVQVSNYLPSFENTLVFEQITNFTYSDNLDYPTFPYNNYYWRVKSFDENQTESEWSEINTFIIPGLYPTWGDLSLYNFNENNPISTISIQIPSQWQYLYPEFPFDAYCVFYSTSFNTYEICGYGFANNSSDTINITAYGDNPNTPEKDGLAYGECYKIKFWNSLNGLSTNLIASYSSGNSYFTPNGFSTVSSLESTLYETYALNIYSGWNMISSNIDISGYSFSSIFGTIINNSNFFIKDEMGNVYWPEWDINDIGNWNITKGYQIYSPENYILALYGFYLTPNQHPIFLNSGWHIIPYLKSFPVSVSTALNTINNNYLLVKDNFGDVYWPEWGIDDIGNMLPRQAYQIYMNEADTLIYSGF